jgi:hypothetical protein
MINDEFDEILRGRNSLFIIHFSSLKTTRTEGFEPTTFGFGDQTSTIELRS